MSRVLELVARARQTGDYAEFTREIPYARWLGISALSREGEIVGRLEFREHLIGNPVIPALHGGTIGALLESTAIFRVLLDQETSLLPKTINLTVAFLRSARPADVWAHATITKQGRRVASVRVEAWQEDRARPIATASVHLLIKPLE